MNNKCINTSKFPCAKFIVIVIITFSVLIFAIVMVIISPKDSPLIPFYSSLISASLTYWLNPPSAYV